MKYNYTYPFKENGITTKYFKIPLKITRKVVPKLKDEVAILPPIGKYIAIKIDLNGWHSSPVPVQYSSKEECKKACNIHNKWICDMAGWEYEFITKIKNKYIL